MQIADIDFCVPADADELYEVERSCFDVPWSRHFIAKDLENLGVSVYLKAMLHCEIAGYGVLTRDGDAAHLMNIAVLPGFRGMGVALQLMIAFDEIAIDWQCDRMNLEVRAANQRARKFYDELGFKFKKKTARFYSDGEDAFILVAKLPLPIVVRGGADWSEEMGD
ncbi:MAG: ribosomal protein S18-alanine N-acetyltransferase [Synergistaceae bacterium]|jgi:ribosomal-protein-alanine N-acetyltransferase|nr:ribosomal protein S18-alanine N-acetyltransferase [Synergistaceae bacterium]